MKHNTRDDAELDQIFSSEFEIIENLEVREKFEKTSEIIVIIELLSFI